MDKRANCSELLGEKNTFSAINSMFHVQLEYSLEKAKEMTQGELTYGSASVEEMITGRFEWSALNNDWHGEKP